MVVCRSTHYSRRLLRRLLRFYESAGAWDMQTSRNACGRLLSSIFKYLFPGDVLLAARVRTADDELAAVAHVFDLVGVGDALGAEVALDLSARAVVDQMTHEETSTERQTAVLRTRDRRELARLHVHLQT